MSHLSSTDPFDPQWLLPLIVLLWFVLTGLISLLSGWSSLTFQFRAEGPARGERFRFASVSMGRRYLPLNYGNCLFVTINDTGFRLAILFPFRFLSPPLLIPWLQLESVADKRFFHLRYAEIRIRGHWPILSIYGRAGRYILELHRHYESAPVLITDDRSPTAGTAGTIGTRGTLGTSSRPPALPPALFP